MSVLRTVGLAILISTVAACGRLEADRSFNYGVQQFHDENYEAAVASFERASESLAHPAIRYNLALAHLKVLQAASADNGREGLAEPIAAALAAVESARSLPEPTDELLAKLGYIEGSVYVVAGDIDAARRSFSRSLEAQPKFKPTLGALLELDHESESTLAALVLANAEIEEMKLMEELAR